MQTAVLKRTADLSLTPHVQHGCAFSQFRIAMFTSPDRNSASLEFLEKAWPKSRIDASNPTRVHSVKRFK